MSDRVDCPVCGKALRDLWDYDWSTREELVASCGSCDAEFLLTRLVSVTYRAEPLRSKP